MEICKYCGRETTTKNSNAQHEIRCKNNPEKIEVIPSYGMKGKKGSNQFVKARESGSPVPKMSEEAIRKGIETKRKNGTLYKTEESKKKLSDAMKLAVQKYPESYRSSNRGRVKQIEYDGIKFQGQWELDFYKWCKLNEIEVIRNESWFEYEWEGIRKYNPDFYLPEYDWYVEVKGYKTERDDAKWSQFPKILKVVSSKEIKEIRENTFALR